MLSHFLIWSNSEIKMYNLIFDMIQAILRWTKVHIIYMQKLQKYLCVCFKKLTCTYFYARYKEIAALLSIIILCNDNFILGLSLYICMHNLKLFYIMQPLVTHSLLDNVYATLRSFQLVTIIEFISF